MLTAGHMNENAVTWFHVGQMKQDLVGSHIIDDESSGILEWHAIRYFDQMRFWQDDVLFPDRVAIEHDDAIVLGKLGDSSADFLNNTSAFKKTNRNLLMHPEIN